MWAFFLRPLFLTSSVFLGPILQIFFLKSLLLLSVFQICIFPKCAISAVDSFISCWSFLPRLLYFFPSQFLQHTTWPTRWPWGRFSSVLSFTACILAIVSFIACWLFLPSQKFPQHPSHNALWVNLVWLKYILKNCNWNGVVEIVIHQFLFCKKRHEKICKVMVVKNWE